MSYKSFICCRRGHEQTYYTAKMQINALGAINSSLICHFVTHNNVIDQTFQVEMNISYHKFTILHDIELAVLQLTHVLSTEGPWGCQR
jgi:hypothetical protein